MLVKTSPGTTRCQRMFRRSRKLVDTSGRPAACRIWSRRELWPECIRIAKGACGESCAGRRSGSARTCDSCSGEFGVVVVVVEGWRGGGSGGGGDVELSDSWWLKTDVTSRPAKTRSAAPPTATSPPPPPPPPPLPPHHPPPANTCPFICLSDIRFPSPSDSSDSALRTPRVSRISQISRISRV